MLFRGGIFSQIRKFQLKFMWCVCAANTFPMETSLNRNQVHLFEFQKFPNKFTFKFKLQWSIQSCVLARCIAHTKLVNWISNVKFIRRRDHRNETATYCPSSSTWSPLRVSSVEMANSLGATCWGNDGLLADIPPRQNVRPQPSHASPTFNLTTNPKLNLPGNTHAIVSLR